MTELSLAAELARMTALFQLRAICLHMGAPPPTILPGEPIRALIEANACGEIE